MSGGLAWPGKEHEWDNRAAVIGSEVEMATWPQHGPLRGVAPLANHHSSASSSGGSSLCTGHDGMGPPRIPLGFGEGFVQRLCSGALLYGTVLMEWKERQKIDARLSPDQVG